MNIDPAAVLALISTLTQQVGHLEQENAQLRQALAERDAPQGPPAP